MPRLLQRLGADLERALSDVNFPAYVIDRDGIVVWLNRAAKEIVGDVEGRPFTEVVAPRDRRRVQEAFLRKLLGKAKVTDFEFEVMGLRGSACGWRSAPCRSCEVTVWSASSASPPGRRCPVPRYARTRG